MKTKVSVVGMIYKSTKWLDSMRNSVEKYCKSDKYDVDFLVIANDANEEVLKHLKEKNVSYIEYNDPKPNDYYLNRVYRAWNFGGMNASGDVVVFINSDMIFSEGWLDKLLAHLNEYTIPCSMLIESGKLPSGPRALSINLGQTLESFNEELFQEMAKRDVNPVVELGGLYMPCAFYKKTFVEAGGYPEGNIYEGGPGAINTGFVRSGDDHFFHFNERMKRMHHITVMNSVVYHFQTGEMDS